MQRASVAGRRVAKRVQGRDGAVELIALLLAGDAPVRITMKKGGLCKLSSDDLIFGQCATLNWLLAPAYLRKLN